MCIPLSLHSLPYMIASVWVCAKDHITIGISLCQGYEGAVDGKLVRLASADGPAE